MKINLTIVTAIFVLALFTIPVNAQQIEFSIPGLSGINVYYNPYSNDLGVSTPYLNVYKDFGQGIGNQYNPYYYQNNCNYYNRGVNYYQNPNYIYQQIPYYHYTTPNYYGYYNNYNIPLGKTGKNRIYLNTQNLRPNSVNIYGY